MRNMKGTVNIHHATSVQLVKREWKGSYWLDITISSPGGEFEVSGGAEGDRTLDLSIANAALSQLSYGPKHRTEP